MLTYYYSPLNSCRYGTIGESRWWNLKWRGTKSFFILVAISLHANRKMATTWPYKLLLTAIVLPMPVRFRWYTSKSSETKWLSVTDFMHWWYGKTGDAERPTSLSCVIWIVLYIRTCFMLTEGLFHELSSHV